MLGFVAEPAIAEVLLPGLRATGLPEGSAPGVAIALALALATVTQMVVGELIPKGLAVARPEGATLLLARPMRAYGLAFGPLITFLNAAANWTVRRLGIEPREELTSVRTIDELELLIRSSREEGALDPGAFTLLTRSIRFGEKSAADALLPRVDVVALDGEATVGDLRRAALDTGHSRFPVIGRDLDDIVGIVHVKDVYRLPMDERDTTPVASIMRPAVAMPESRDLESLLPEMRARALQMVVVVDEYGGTAGILTLEDVLEEIVGEIQDEYDPVTLPPHLTAARAVGVWVLEASLHHDEVREVTGLDLPEGDYETLGGFLLSSFGRIPEAGDRTSREGWDFEVLALHGLRISLVRVSAPQDEDLAAP